MKPSKFGMASALIFGLTGNVLAQEAIQDGGDMVFAPFAHLRLRYESTSDIPGRLDDIRRFRGRLRAGVVAQPSGLWEFGASLEGTQGTKSNIDAKRNKDNELDDSATLDTLYARLLFSEQSELLIGKFEMPLSLSPLVWDQDIRTIGLNYQHEVQAGERSNFRVGLGYYLPSFVYVDDEPRLSAGQLSWNLFPGEPMSFSVHVSYLNFDQLQGVPNLGVARTNRRLGPNFVSDYEMGDIQLVGRFNVLDMPLVARVEGLRNFGAKDQRDATRSSLTLGRAETGGFEAGFAYQRAQRDAVLAIAADDDWWFQSFARGAMPWMAYGFESGWVTRFSAFDERRDGVNENTLRLLFDVSKQW